MKKCTQIIMLILLTGNLIVSGINCSKLASTQRQLSYLYNVIEYQDVELLNSTNSEYIQTNLSEGFKVIQISNEITGYIKDKKLLTSTISFSMIDNKDIEKVYIVLENDETGIGERFEAQSSGNLEYTANIELSYDSKYIYYVIGEDKHNDICLLSDKKCINVPETIRTMADLHMEYSSFTKNQFTAKGIVLYKEDIAELDKIELSITAYQDDEFLKGNDSEGTVLYSMDITNKLFPINEVNYDIPIEMDDEYQVYAFDISYKSENINYTDYEFLNVEITYHFADGNSITLY